MSIFVKHALLKHKFKDLAGIISDIQHGSKTSIPNAHHDKLHALTHLHDGVDPLFWKRMAFVTQFGTTGDDRSSGSGNVLINYDFYFVTNTGTTIDSFMERVFNLPWIAISFKQEWEVGIKVRVDSGYSQRYFLWGNGYMIINAHVYTFGEASQYVGFWLVYDETYYRRILAITRNASNTSITDCGGWAVNDRFKLRVECVTSNLFRYYVDNVLKATHTTPTIDFTGGPYMKVGISNQATNDESHVFYYVRARCDY